MKAECPVAGEGIGNWKNRRPQWTYQKQNAWAYNQAGGRGNKNGWNSGKELKAERVAKRVSPRHVLGEFMAGCSLEDLHFLLSFNQLEENIYHLDMVNQSLVIKDQHLPWPVRFVLARFNRKHIFSAGGLPCEQEVARCVNELVQNTKWLWNFSRR